MQSVTYSFVDCSAQIIGPGALFDLGNGAGVADEGITIEMLEDKGSVVMGADGTPMQTLHAGSAGRVTVRLLKTSTVNALLAAAYHFQTLTSANWGQNLIVVRMTAWGDVITASACAFQKFPNLTYAKEAGTNEWVFSAGQIIGMLGSGAGVNGIVGQ